MPSRTGFFSLAVVAVLAFAGCGSTGTNKAIVLTGTNTGPQPELKYSPVRSAAYNVSLSGTNGVAGPLGARRGAPNGSGVAVINIDASRRTLCWKFSQLENVPAPRS